MAEQKGRINGWWKARPALENSMDRHTKLETKWTFVLKPTLFGTMAWPLARTTTHGNMRVQEWVMVPPDAYQKTISFLSSRLPTLDVRIFHPPMCTLAANCCRSQCRFFGQTSSRCCTLNPLEMPPPSALFPEPCWADWFFPVFTKNWHQTNTTATRETTIYHAFVWLKTADLLLHRTIATHPYEQQINVCVVRHSHPLFHQQVRHTTDLKSYNETIVAWMVKPGCPSKVVPSGPHAANRSFSLRKPSTGRIPAWLRTYLWPKTRNL